MKGCALSIFVIFHFGDVIITGENDRMTAEHEKFVLALLCRVVLQKMSKNANPNPKSLTVWAK
jgi:hypothetical protein